MGSDHRLVALAVRSGVDRPLPETVAEVTANHTAMHVAEGELYRDVWADAAAGRDLGVALYPRKDAIGDAAAVLGTTANRLGDVLAALGASWARRGRRSTARRRPPRWASCRATPRCDSTRDAPVAAVAGDPVTRARDGWVVTCDPGVDDAVALAVAAGCPDLKVTAVVAGAGNVDVATAWRNAAACGRAAGLDVPVTMGSPTTVTGAPIHRERTSHGADGLAGLAGALPDVAPGQGDLVSRGRRGGHDGHDGHDEDDDPPAARGQALATGPLTDVALALPPRRLTGRPGRVAGDRSPARRRGPGGG